MIDLDKTAKRVRKQRIETFQRRILEHGKQAGGPFYIDEVDFDDLLSGRQGEGKSPNLIGIATRILITKKAIVRTSKYRNSTREGSNRRLIFEYVLASAVTKPTKTVRWDLFPSYLIDHCEGEVISEEMLQRSLAAMLADVEWLSKAK